MVSCFFFTLVSKSGAYFYLIIDRAADGEQTARFLNMADEANLLALMDEEEIVLPNEPDVGADEDAARQAYQTSDGYEE